MGLSKLCLLTLVLVCLVALGEMRGPRRGGHGGRRGGCYPRCRKNEVCKRSGYYGFKCVCKRNHYLTYSYGRRQCKRRFYGRPHYNPRPYGHHRRGNPFRTAVKFLAIKRILRHRNGA